MNESIETSENEAVTPMTAERIISMIHPDIPPATAHFLLNEAKPLLVELEQLQAQGGSQHKGANMIDNNELISTLRERAALYAYGSADSMACTAAASLLEAQACEIERHDIEYSVRGLLLLDTERERDQLRAELAAIKAQEPVGSVNVTTTPPRRNHHFTPLARLPDGINELFAAPVAPAQPVPQCTWSHPHELMDGYCELRTEIAKLSNENARQKADQPQGVNAELVEALKEAATSLETISRLAGKTHYVGDDGERVETYMGHHDQVRGYAISRAGVARTALSQAQSAPVQGVPEGWQPIETAPKWKNVLLFSIRYGSIFIDDWALYCTTNHPQITHWMPLPAVPRQEQKGGE